MSVANIFHERSEYISINFNYFKTMESPVQEIKERLDIVEVIGQYVKLAKAGANFKAPCPFHSEKSASFFVSPAKQIWRCFGCQKGGDAFTFIKEIEGVEFGDALRILAAKAGIELKPQTREAAELKTERQRLYEVCDLAARFFEKQLNSSQTGLEAKSYLQKRGLNESSIKLWRIGYAPDLWRGLSNFLATAGYSTAEIEKAGLVVRGNSGAFDRFRGRIMFPIFDFYSQVVGFGGRVFKERTTSAAGENETKEAKYVNTPATMLYDKGRILYGLDKAKVVIKKLNGCVVVEGYTDVIMSVQAGVENIVSSSGTALTLGQLKLIKRFTDNLILGYDMDLAGDTANKRGIDLALGQGFNVLVARPPFEGKDPADVIFINPKEWEKAVANAKSIMDYNFENALNSNDAGSALGKKAIARLLLPLIKQMPNTIEQSHWLQILATSLGGREQDLREELKKVKLEQYALAGENRQNETTPQKSRNQLVEERLLALIFKYRQFTELLDDEIISFFSAPVQEIAAKIKQEKENDRSVIASENIREKYDALSLQAEVEEIGEREAGEEIYFHINEIKKTIIKTKLERVAGELRQAEKKNDTAQSQKLHQDFNELSKLTQKLEENRNKSKPEQQA